MFLVFIWILNLKYSSFNSHKWSVGGFRKRYHWKLQNTELVVESRLWWNMKNSYALSLPDTIFYTLFYIFFNLKRFQEGQFTWRKMLIFPAVKNYLASYPCLTRKDFMCNNWTNQAGKFEPEKEANTCVLSWIAYCSHLAFSCVTMELLDPRLVPILDSPGLFSAVFIHFSRSALRHMWVTCLWVLFVIMWVLESCTESVRL